MSAWSANAWFTTAWYSGAWSTTVAIPATTAGGGKKIRRYSRSMAYFEPIRKEKKKHLEQIRQEVISRAAEIAKQQQIEIDQARQKAREAIYLEALTRKAKETGKILLTLSKDSQALKAKALEAKQLEDAILAILMSEVP